MMVLDPILDPTIVNYFANHPDIRLGGDADVDLSAGVREPNVFLVGDHGAFCWTWSAPDTFEVHVMLTRAGRGKWGFRAAREAMDYMKAAGALQLWGRVHPERPEIAVLGRHVGMRDTEIKHTLDAGDGPVSWRIFNWRA